MNKQEYANWRREATICLLGKYNCQETAIILAWFDNMETDSEFLLTGSDVQECLGVVRGHIWPISMYNDMMMRLWLYAPLILKLEN